MSEEREDRTADGSATRKWPQRIAVIGVHGIAHHDPGETANAMADLLLSLPPYNPENPHSAAKKPFKVFRSLGIQIPLKPVTINREKRVDTQDDGVLHRGARFLQEESAEFARALTQEQGQSKEGTAENGVDLKFTRRLLQDYQGGAVGNAYITTRLEGQRAGHAGLEPTDVHIYELFWADLARPTNSVVSFFLAVFQLVLHLPSLSRLAIDTHAASDWRWKAYQFAHRYAARILQIVLPMLKIVLLVALAAAAPAVAKVRDLAMLAAVLAATIVTSVCFLLANHFRKPAYRNRMLWLVLSFSPGLALGVATYVLIRRNDWKQEIVLALVVWLLGALLLWYALQAYQNVRPGIQLAGWSFYIMSFVMFWGWAAAGHAMASDSLWVAEWLLVLLRLSWLSLVVLAIAAFLLGELVWRTEEKEEEKAKARAAVRTSRLALALPAFFFVFITGMIWAGFFSAANTVKGSSEVGYFDLDVVHEAVAPGLAGLDKIRSIDLFPHRGIGDDFRVCYGDCYLHPDFLKGVLAWSLGYGIWVVGLVTATGLLILIWWVLPSVVTERFPLREAILQGEKIRTEPPRSSTNPESVWFGAWISRGLDSFSLVTYAIWCGIFLVPLVFLFPGTWRAYFESTTKMMICQAITIAASVALLTSMIRYSSPVLRCILDVDTYLRAGPAKATPRAKIFERYTSLLRYIAQYEQDGQGYDAVVIVAHSLGSLISADLLRLLKDLRDDPELSPLGFGPKPQPSQTIPIRLFTMGNPLRQLLNRFWPYLYSWVCERPDNAMAELPAPLEKAPSAISPGALPNPAGLGVSVWVNAYRSGDYVGRSLWLDEWYRRTDAGLGLYPEPVCVIRDSEKRPNRFEFCIGGGAHTHYWDDTAPDIALWLDRLV